MKKVAAISGVVAGFVALALIAGFALQPHPARAEGQGLPDKSVSAAPLRFSVVGDSITAGCQWPLTDHTEPCTWPYWVEKAGLDFVGGWAQPRADSELMAENVKHENADVVVILAGTNNVNTGLTFAETADTYTRIVATVGAPRVVVLLLPPFQKFAPTGEVAAYNMQLAQFARAHGWEVFNPWLGLSTLSPYEWIPGTSYPDHEHPSMESQQVIGGLIAAYLNQK